MTTSTNTNTNINTKATKSSPIRIGLVGAAGRSGTLGPLASSVGFEITALCDINEEGLARAQQQFKAKKTFTDYSDMLDSGEIDAVIVGTPMQLHVEQSIAALEHDIHVLSEVTAAVTVEQCKELVACVEKSSAVYMMAENSNYLRPNMFINSLVEAGLFGEVYYAEGEYLHELKALFEETPWRRKWQSGVHGVTYPSHSLGPILQWFKGDRVTRVCCAESGSHYADPRGDKYACDTAVMLAQTAAGRLIKLRMDIVSDRPQSLANYQLQGTDGAYESSRGGPGDLGKLWLKSHCSTKEHWLELDTLMNQSAFAEFLPAGWRDATLKDILKTAGHGGSDYFIFEEFAKTIRGEIPCPIDIHQALDMTLPGIVSEQAVLRNEWVEVPDSRQWVSGGNADNVGNAGGGGVGGR